MSRFLPTEVNRYFRTIFSLDLRSLALFRVTLGCVILMDLYQRSLTLSQNYTDSGNLPREVLRSYFVFSPLHTLTGSTAGEAFLFILQALLAILLIIGYRTRLVTLLSFLFHISLVQRNLPIVEKQNMVPGVLLLWSLFLPLNAYWSVDRALDRFEKKIPDSIASVATAGYLMQTLVMYLTTALYKWRFAPWKDGQALWMTLHVDTYVQPIGQWLLQFPMLLKGLSYGSLFVEGVVPFFLLVAWNIDFFRMFFFEALLFLHISIWLTLFIGVFQPASVVAIIAFLPSSFWEHLSRQFYWPLGGAKLYFDADCGFCRKSVLLFQTFLGLPKSMIMTAQEKGGEILRTMKENNSWVFEDENGKLYAKYDVFLELLTRSPIFKWSVRIFSSAPLRWIGGKVYGRVSGNRSFHSKMIRWLSYRPLSIDLSLRSKIAAAFMSLLILFTNLINFWGLSFPWGPRVTQAFHIFYLNQRWAMFSNLQVVPAGWFNFIGTLADGTLIDLRSGGPATWEKPVRSTDLFPNTQSRAYWNNLTNRAYRDLQPVAGEYLCRKWNQTEHHTPPLRHVTVYYIDLLFDKNYRTSFAPPVAIVNQPCRI